MEDLTYRLPQVRSIKQGPPGPETEELARRRRRHVPRAVAPTLPGAVVDADGGVLVDADGNSFIDFSSGIAVTSAGASNPAVAEAVAEAAQHFTHTCYLVSPYENYVEVAEKLGELTPGDHEKRTMLFSTGAEAIENAVKIARAHTGRRGVAVLDGGFHGRTNLTLAMTTKPRPYKKDFGPFAGDIHRAPMSYPVRDGLTGEDAAARTIAHLERTCEPGEIACLVAEPVQGEGGFVVPATGFLPALAEWCRGHGIVFVADEIQAGIGRTGTWFATEHEELVPDLVCSAKALANGLPLSAVTGRAEIMDAPAPGSLGGTYGGNPVACAAALATLAEMERMSLPARAREIETVAREELDALNGLSRVAEVRGRGAMIAVELVDAAGRPDPQAVADVAVRCAQAGVLVLTCGIDGNVIRLLPSLTIPEDLLRDGLRQLVREIVALDRARARAAAVAGVGAASAASIAAGVPGPANPLTNPAGQTGDGAGAEARNEPGDDLADADPATRRLVTAAAEPESGTEAGPEAGNAGTGAGADTGAAGATGATGSGGGER
ncbi:hypothetical protein COFR110785_06400 [Corynebacterium frankenforstense]